MATKPLTTESIAMTEKKMEMSLEEIIKMSKKNAPTKGGGKRPPRVSIKNQGFRNGGRAQANTYKVQNYLDSRSSIRQGALARKRSNAPGSQFPLITEAARRAANAPIQNRGFNSFKPRVAPVQKDARKPSEQDKAVPRPRQTLDARFANMKEQRMMMSQQMNHGRFIVNASRYIGQQQRRQQQRGRGGAAPGGAGRRPGNFGRY